MNNHNTARIAIAVEQPIVRYGLRQLFDAAPGLAVVGVAGNSLDAIRRVLQLRPEILVLELTATALETLGHLLSLNPTVRTLLLGSPESGEQIAQAFNLGVRGVVYKGSATSVLLNGVRTIIAGRYWFGEVPLDRLPEDIGGFTERRLGGNGSTMYGLTRRELQIVAAIAAGCSNKDVGRKLSITERTVKHHLTNIYGKLGVASRLELAVFALNHKLHIDQTGDSGGCPDGELKYAEAV